MPPRFLTLIALGFLLGFSNLATTSVADDDAPRLLGTWTNTDPETRSYGRIDLVATDMAATTHYREKVAMGEMDDNAWCLDWAETRQYMRNAV